MSHKAPGKAFRKGITIKKIMDMFPDDATAEQWIIQQRWSSGVCCPMCGSTNVKTGCKHKTMPFRCRENECGKRFSTKTETVMEGSKIGFRDWVIATFLLTTSLKSVASMKLYRDLGVTQKSSWFLAHRLRVALTRKCDVFSGPIEVDEIYMGGLRRNLSNSQRRQLGTDAGRGPVGKTAVVGIKDRPTNHIAAKVVEATDKSTLHGFIEDHAAPKAKVYSDDAAVYESLSFHHETVKHSLSQYVRGDAHTNGIESLWSMLKRAHKSTFHKLSPKHLDRYIQEFAARHNLRGLDTLDQMASICTGMEFKRLRYRDLIADNGLPSGARG